MTWLHWVLSFSCNFCLNTLNLGTHHSHIAKEEQQVKRKVLRKKFEGKKLLSSFEIWLLSTCFPNYEGSWVHDFVQIYLGNRTHFYRNLWFKFCSFVCIYKFVYVYIFSVAKMRDGISELCAASMSLQSAIEEYLVIA